MSNKINAYICPALHHTITIMRVEGVTSMYIKCPECEKHKRFEKAVSLMGKVYQHFTPNYEWYKPTDEEWRILIADVNNEVLIQQLRDHVL